MPNLLEFLESLLQALFWMSVGGIAAVQLLLWIARRDAKRESAGERVSRSMANWGPR